MTVTHTYTKVGTYTPRLVVTDSGGATSSSTSTVTVAARAGTLPWRGLRVALFGPPPLEVSFDASDSSDPDGVVSSYEWTFGDGDSASGVSTTHTYVTPGAYIASLTITDDDDNTASAQQQILVQANRAPRPQDDSEVADPAVGFDVLGNDFDEDGDSLTLTDVSVPAHGTAKCGPDGGCLYTAAGGYVGPDEFTYTASDGKGNSATAHVSIDVQERAVGGENQLVAVTDRLTTATGVAGSVDVLANDSGTGLALVSATNPDHGAVDCVPSGLCTYTPAAGFSGYDGFSYVISDAAGASASATVEIVVAAAATHQPVVTGGPDSIVQGGSADWVVAESRHLRARPDRHPGLQREVNVVLTDNHEVDPASITTAPGWASTVGSTGLTLSAGPDAMIGESTSQVLPTPANPISQGTGGDGHVPILVGSKVFGSSITRFRRR